MVIFPQRNHQKPAENATGSSSVKNKEFTTCLQTHSCNYSFFCVNFSLRITVEGRWGSF